MRYSNKRVNIITLIEQSVIGFSYQSIGNFSQSFFRIQSQWTKFSKCFCGGMPTTPLVWHAACSLTTFLGFATALNRLGFSLQNRKMPLFIVSGDLRPLR